MLYNLRPRQLTRLYSVLLQYSVPVIKYDRNGFKPRPRQLILTQTAAYVLEEAKIKQRVLYTSLKGYTSCFNLQLVREIFFIELNMCVIWLITGISVSNLSDSIIVLHITCEDPKQKVNVACQYLDFTHSVDRNDQIVTSDCVLSREIW